MVVSVYTIVTTTDVSHAVNRFSAPQLEFTNRSFHSYYEVGKMTLLDFGVYAGIIGGSFFLILLVLFRNRFSGRNRISWVLLLEMAIFTVLTGFSTW